MSEPDRLNVSDLAVELHCTEEDVRELIRAGELRTVACGVRPGLVPRHELDTYRRRAQRVIVRPQEPSDYEAALRVYTEAFRRSEDTGSTTYEAGVFSALWDAKDVIDALSFTATRDDAVVGHVTASRARVESHAVVAVGPIGVLPERQGEGVGSALMTALLSAADTRGTPLVVLLGSPQYYSRFGFRPAVELGVIPPDPNWGDAFQGRPLAAYSPSIAGAFRYAPAFSS